MKKKAMFFITLICVVLCFLVWQQKSRLVDQLSTQLIKNQIQLANVHSQILPTPQLVLNQVQFNHKEQSIFFDKIVIKLSLFSLFKAKVQLTEIEFYNGHYPQENIHSLNLTLKPTALYLNDIYMLTQAFGKSRTFGLPKIGKVELIATGETTHNQFHFQGNLALNDRLYLSKFQGRWRFKYPVYDNMDGLEFMLQQGEVILGKSSYYFDLTELMINQAYLPKSKIQLNVFPTFFMGNVDLAYQGRMSFHFTNSNSQLQFLAQDIELEQWFRLLKLPVIAIGKAKVNGQFSFNQQQIEKGEMDLQVFDGKVKNVNLLAIVAQRLPINFDVENLQDIDSPFEQLTARLHWNPNKMEWENILLHDKYFQLSGRGSQSNQQCDFRVNLSLREEKYQNFHLPLHFFGNCNSPQYRIESAAGLKQQLKELLKQRFSR